MENTSKALIMAGAILIALIIIALLVQSFSGVRDFQMEQLSQEEQAQLIAFNEQYTKYLGQYVYGIEVRSLINKYESDKKVIVYYDVEPPEGIGQDTTYYKCETISYDEETGRVESITFRKVTLNSGN